MQGMEPPGSVGRRKESAALAYLTQRGLRLVTRNYRCRRGEIDLIMEHDGTLVFVEVRFRRSGTFGTAAESIDQRKRARIIMAANHFLQRHRDTRPCRFDVVAITGNVPEWITDAFEA